MKKMNLVLILILALVMGTLPTLSSKTAEAANDYPTWIMAPSINLFAPIQGMGINDKGELDVPSGSSNNVGWYAGGVLPGDTGTAVLDAHVFAAFRNLSSIKPGEYIYMFMASGKILSFQVKDYGYHALKGLSPYALFTPTQSKRLNLITCAGNYVQSLATYSHRLIVSAELV